MDKTKINIEDFKNILITTDGDSGRTRNFLVSEKLANTSQKRGFYFDLHFDAGDVELRVDTSFYDSIDMSEHVHVYKDWRFDMYFKYNDCVCHAPLYRFVPKGCGFQPTLFCGVITELDEIEGALEVNNYLHTMQKMGY